MEDIKKLAKFIKDNKLNFEGVGSDLNSNIIILSGYADYIGVNNYKILISAITTAYPGKVISDDLLDETKRVFEFAYKFNYGNWWKKKEAELMYKF